MSSITEVEFVELLHQTRIRLSSNPNSRFRLSTEHTQQQMKIPSSLEENDEDVGLVMKMDTQHSVPTAAKLCGQSQAVVGLALTSASAFQSISEVLLKKLNQLTELIQKEVNHLVPFLLYVSLLVMGFQAMAVVVLLTSAAKLSLGIYFLLTCAVVILGLFIYTSHLGLTQQPTPPPTPSQSSTSLSSYNM